MNEYSYKLTSELLDSMIEFSTYNTVLDLDYLIDSDTFDADEDTLFTYDTYISHMYNNNLFVSFLEKKIKELFPTQLSMYGVEVCFEVGKIVQPQYYNFKNDYIDIDVKVSLNHLTSVIDMFSNEFDDFLKKYESFPGFISFMPTSVSDWIDADDDYKVATAINFLAERIDFPTIDNFTIYESIEVVDAHDFIDTNTFNDYLFEMNDLFNLIVQSFRKNTDIDINSLDYTYIDNIVNISKYINEQTNQLKKFGQYEIRF